MNIRSLDEPTQGGVPFTKRWGRFGWIGTGSTDPSMVKPCSMDSSMHCRLIWHISIFRFMMNRASGSPALPACVLECIAYRVLQMGRGAENDALINSTTANLYRIPYFYFYWLSSFQARIGRTLKIDHNIHSMGNIDRIQTPNRRQKLVPGSVSWRTCLAPRRSIQ